MKCEIISRRVANDAHPLSLTASQDVALEILNEYEVPAIRSLCGWVAAEQGTTPEAVCRATSAHFGTSDIATLPRKSYDEVIRFLLGLRIDKIH